MIKDVFVGAADSLFRDFKNKSEIMSAIKAVQLSRNTVTVHVVDLTQQLRKDMTDCERFSLQLDECTTRHDTAQLCVFIRMVFKDMTAREEMLTLLPMREHTRAIFQSFKDFVDKTQIKLTEHLRC